MEATCFRLNSGCCHIVKARRLWVRGGEDRLLSPWKAMPQRWGWQPAWVLERDLTLISTVAS